MSKVFKAWHQCGLCEFQGPMEFRHLPNEDYSGPSEAVLLAVVCPSCGEADHLLIGWDHYQELTAQKS